MTSQSPRIYIYKITFEEVLYYYYGVHKEERYNEYYMGSPISHKWIWEFYTPKKQILEIFDFTNEGWLEAQEIEKRLIRPFFNTDEWCLNENCGGIISLDILKENGKRVSEKYSSLNGIKNGNRAKELGIGIHGRTKEQMTEDGKKGGKIVGTKNHEMKIGIFGRNKEQHTIDSKLGGKIAKELGLGIHALTPEQQTQRSKKAGKNTSSQRWQCLETGYISTPAGLSNYQRKRDIDTSKRIKLS